MEISLLDYSIIIGFFTIVLIIGLVVSRRSGKDTAEFFLSGRSMPWWLLGFSMVATTFSTDTPNFVTNLVRKDGVSGNWMWWSFLLTGLSTVFIYAKLWRKSDVLTDMEFYELRYGGKVARFLRGFRSIYLGFVFNVLTLSAVNLAAIKIAGIMLGISPVETVLFGGVITAIFSTIGGFRGVIYTDFVLFFVAIIGAIWSAVYLVNIPEVGGLSNLINHKNVMDKISIFPDLSNTDIFMSIMVIPLAVQWWSAWYPGGEPGGGGYIAQRMLAAKNENHAIGSTFFFNIMHYGLRPWPWILVALASLIVYPDVASIKDAFPNISADKLGDDLAYSAMLTKLPSGLLGIVLASLGAAYMSTISTQLNWGSSYIVNDFYKQQVDKKASEKKLVAVGRISTVLLMVMGAVVALFLTDAKQLFEILLEFGAGTGLVYILRWFWWRINAWSEIIAMVAASIVSFIFNFTDIGNSLFGYMNANGILVEGTLPGWSRFPIIVSITTVCWVLGTYLTKPESDEKLYSFYKKTQPGGPGWKSIIEKASLNKIPLSETSKKWYVPSGIKAMLVGSVLVYSVMFFTGKLLYGEYLAAFILFVVSLISGFWLKRIWFNIKSDIL